MKNRFEIEEKILGWKIWIHVVIGLCTYLIWFVVLIIIFLDLKNHEKNKYANIQQPLYQKEFVISNCETYIDNINEIVNLSLTEEDFNKYNGTPNKDIKEYGLEVGEIDNQLTPDVKLNYYKGSTKEYIGVSIYHKEFDKFLKVGNIPDDEFETLKPLLEKKVLIWGSYVGGKFKTTNEEDKITTYTKPIKIKLLIKVFEH